MGVLYDRDHYKLALGQLNTCKKLCETVCRDYARAPRPKRATGGIGVAATTRGRGDAAAAARIFRGDQSRRRVAATPRPDGVAAAPPPRPGSRGRGRDPFRGAAKGALAVTRR